MTAVKILAWMVLVMLLGSLAFVVAGFTAFVVMMVLA